MDYTVIMNTVFWTTSHKRGMIIMGGVLIVGGAICGTVSYVAHLKKSKLDKQFGEALQIYLDAAKA